VAPLLLYQGDMKGEATSCCPLCRLYLGPAVEAGEAYRAHGRVHSALAMLEARAVLARTQGAPAAGVTTSSERPIRGSAPVPGQGLESGADMWMGH
jgi:hypothetical protein